MTTIKNVTEKKIKKVKSLIGFLSANKSITTTEVGEREKKKRIYRTSQKVIIINVFLESLLSESFPTMTITFHLTFLGCPPTLYRSLDLLWGLLRF